jgi:hypothetical protein
MICLFGRMTFETFDIQPRGVTLVEYPSLIGNAFFISLASAAELGDGPTHSARPL